MARGNVLVVDDEEDILELIRFNLERDGYDVRTVTTGEEALLAAAREPPDVIVLDLMLPGLDGLEVCRRLKRDAATQAIPVLMLTAKTEDTDIVSGLEVGADDYVTKPFSPRVLVARIRAALRRGDDGPVRSQSEAVIRVQDLRIDVSRHEVRAGEEPVDLSATEFAILALLAGSPGRVFSREAIIDSVKGRDYPVTERAVDVQILGLRRKLGTRGSYIETVRGVGYRIRAE